MYKRWNVLPSTEERGRLRYVAHQSVYESRLRIRTKGQSQEKQWSLEKQVTQAVLLGQAD